MKKKGDLQRVKRALVPDVPKRFLVVVCPHCETTFGYDGADRLGTVLCPSCGVPCLAWEADRASAPCSPGCPGVGVFEANFAYPPRYERGYVHIQKCDECRRFESDFEAAKFVSSMAVAVDIANEKEFFCSTVAFETEFESWCEARNNRKIRFIVSKADAHMKDLLPHRPDQLVLETLILLCGGVLGGDMPADSARAELVEKFDTLVEIRRQIEEGMLD